MSSPSYYGLQCRELCTYSSLLGPFPFVLRREGRDGVRRRERRRTRTYFEQVTVSGGTWFKSWLKFFLRFLCHSTQIPRVVSLNMSQPFPSQAAERLMGLDIEEGFERQSWDECRGRRGLRFGRGVCVTSYTVRCIVWTKEWEGVNLIEFYPASWKRAVQKLYTTRHARPHTHTHTHARFTFRLLVCLRSSVSGLVARRPCLFCSTKATSVHRCSVAWQLFN